MHTKLERSIGIGALVAFAALILFSANTYPMGLVLVMCPLSVLAGACAIWAGFHPQGLCSKIGNRLLAVIFIFTLAAFPISALRSTHLLWNTLYPSLGLMLSSGLLLNRVWRADRESLELSPKAPNGALLTWVGIAVICGIPIVILSLRPLGGAQVAGPLVPALWEVATYGFGGELPSQMQPVSEFQIERNLGHPPREITVAMGSTMVGAIYLLVFAGLALLGRLIRRSDMQSILFACAPVPIAVGLFFYLGAPGESALWRNAPWLVRSYGPLLAVSVAVNIALAILLRVDAKPSANRSKSELK